MHWLRRSRKKTRGNPGKLYVFFIVLSEDFDEFVQVMLIEPSQIRTINELLQKECKGKGRVETLTFAATADNN